MTIITLERSKRWISYPDVRFHAAIASLGAEGEYLERNYPAMMPPAWPGAAVTMASDYGGEYPGSDFAAYSFLLASADDIAEHLRRMGELRSHTLKGGRAISFKDRHYGPQSRAQTGFLSAANQIPGVLATILVDRSTGWKPAFKPVSKPGPGMEGKPELGPLADLSKRGLEHLLLIAIYGTTLLAGLVRGDQGVRWISDDDPIVANAKRSQLFGGSVAFLRGRLQPGTELLTQVTSPRAWTTPARRLEMEDLLWLPDYAAGVLPVLMTAWRRSGYNPDSKLVQLLPRDLDIPDDVRDIVSWIGDDRHPLRRWVFLTSPIQNGQEWRFGLVRLGGYGVLR